MILLARQTPYPYDNPKILWGFRPAVDCFVKSLRAVSSRHGEVVQRQGI